MPDQGQSGLKQYGSGRRKRHRSVYEVHLERECIVRWSDNRESGRGPASRDDPREKGPAETALAQPNRVTNSSADSRVYSSPTITIATAGVP